MLGFWIIKVVGGRKSDFHSPCAPDGRKYHNSGGLFPVL